MLIRRRPSSSSKIMIIPKTTAKLFDTVVVQKRCCWTLLLLELMLPSWDWGSRRLMENQVFSGWRWVSRFLLILNDTTSIAFSTILIGERGLGRTRTTFEKSMESRALMMLVWWALKNSVFFDRGSILSCTCFSAWISCSMMLIMIETASATSLTIAQYNHCTTWCWIFRTAHPIVDRA